MAIRTSLSAMLCASPLIFGCTAADRTLGAENRRSPSANFTNGPGTAGPLVVRFQDGFFAILNVDETTNLQSVIGLPDDPTASAAPFCDGAGAFEVLDWQLVIHPSGPINALIQAGAVNVHIYDASAFGALFLAGDFCGAVSLPRIAEGKATLRNTDNDLTFSGTRANAFGWTASGTIQRFGDGRPVQYLDVARFAIGPSGASHVHSKVQLTDRP
jgi:hypothetical protein